MLLCHLRPEGHRSSGWKGFQNALLKHPISLRPALPSSKLECYSSKAILGLKGYRDLCFGKINNRRPQTFLRSQILWIRYDCPTPPRKIKPLRKANGRKPLFVIGLIHLRISKKLPLPSLKNVIFVLSPDSFLGDRRALFFCRCNPSCLKGSNLLDSKHNLSTQISQDVKRNRHKFFTIARKDLHQGLPFDS